MDKKIRQKTALHIFYASALTLSVWGCINIESPAISTGGPVIQKIVPSTYNYISNCFWNNTHLTCVDRSTQQVICWCMYDGSVTHLNLSMQVPGEELAFYIPQKDKPNQVVVGSGHNIRTGSFSDGEVVLGSPVAVTTDQGFEIRNVHADKNGVLLMILRRKVHHKSRLYNFKNGVAELLTEYVSDIQDFAFSPDYSKVYLVTDKGNTLTVADYNLEESKISNEKLFHDFNEEFHLDHISAIEIDSDGQMWLQCFIRGHLVQWDPEEKEIKQLIKMPTGGNTAITFAGMKNKDLIVASSKVCDGNLRSKGTIYFISGLFASGEADNEVTV